MIEIILSFLLLSGVVVYFVFTNWILKGLKKLKKQELKPVSQLPAISVILPARNEDHNIEETLDSLAAQEYPRDKFEVIMVDDRSQDMTRQIMDAFAKKFKNFRIVEIEELPAGISPKKNAVEWGIAASKGEIIITTDADCVHSPKWLHALVSCFTPEVGLAAGLVILEPDDETLAHKLHALDYISQTLVGAGAIGNGSSMNCTAANFAYRYEAFMEIGGFGDSQNITSGDDEFLLHKIIDSKKWKAVYALGDDTIVRSLPPETIKGILNQRLRWGSKGIYYPPKVRNWAILIFAFLLIMMLSPILFLLNLLPLCVIITAIVLKLYSDFSVMYTGLKIFNLKFYPVRFILLFIIHPLEIVLSAVGGHLIPFKWKGDLFHSKIHLKS